MQLNPSAVLVPCVFPPMGQAGEVVCAGQWRDGMCCRGGEEEKEEECECVTGVMGVQGEEGLSCKHCSFSAAFKL